MNKGVTHEYTAPHTSAHIGHVERMHRTLMSKSRTMHIYANLPPFLWDELYLTASHLHAKTTTCSLNGKTPWELWYGRKPDYSYIHEVSCHAFMLILNKHNPKIYERSIECVFIGCDAKSKSYCCYNHDMRQVYSSYHVCFLESHNCPAPSGTAIPMHDPPVESTTEPITNDTVFEPICIDADMVDNEIHSLLPSSPEVISEGDHNQPFAQRSTQIHHNAHNAARLECAIQDSNDSATHLKAQRTERKKTLKELHASTPHVDPPMVNETGPMNTQDISPILMELSIFDCADELRT